MFEIFPQLPGCSNPILGYFRSMRSMIAARGKKSETVYFTCSLDVPTNFLPCIQDVGSNPDCGSIGCAQMNLRSPCRSVVLLRFVGHSQFLEVLGFNEECVVCTITILLEMIYLYSTYIHIYTYKSQQVVSCSFLFRKFGVSVISIIHGWLYNPIMRMS